MSPLSTLEQVGSRSRSCSGYPGSQVSRFATTVGALSVNTNPNTTRMDGNLPINNAIVLAQTSLPSLSGLSGTPKSIEKSSKGTGALLFPNIYQHRVDPFELADPRKPGYRKILCFFLVDPTTRILSTSDVPPQQKEWATEAMLHSPALHRLPVELFDMVVDHLGDAYISRKEAEEHREKLMAERANFVVEHNETVYEMEFNMCEH